MRTISPFLWFDDDAEQAVALYTTVFPDSAVQTVQRYQPDTPGPEGAVMTIDFTLNGTGFTALNGGPHFRFTEAVSFVVPCESQAEVDQLWDALTADGGEPGNCGWLKDRFGVSWQIVPTALPDLIGGPDPDGAARAMQAMLGMHKLEIADLQTAYDGS